MKLNRFAAAAAVVFQCAAALALNPPDNLIPDYDFGNFAGTWKIAPPKIRYEAGIVQQFEGMPEMFHYRTFHGRFSMQGPGFTLKPDTWYELCLVFRNPGNVPAGQSGLAVAVKNGKQLVAAGKTGNTDRWSRFKLRFNSRKNTAGNVVISGNSSELSLGWITLVPVSKTTDRSPNVVDGGASSLNPGQLCPDFALRKGKTDAIKAAGEGKERFYRVEIPGGANPSFLEGAPFLMREGESVRSVIWVRAAKPALIHYSVNAPLGLYCRIPSHTAMLPAGKWVALKIDRSLPDRHGLSKNKNIKNPKTLYDGYILCRPTLRISSSEPNTIDFDNYSATLIAASENQVVNTKNKVVWNPSWETGLWGWSYRFYEKPTPNAGKSRFYLVPDAAVGSTALKVIKGVDNQNKRQNVVMINAILKNLPVLKEYTLSFYAKSDRDREPLQVTFKKTSRRNVRYQLTTQWKRYSQTFRILTGSQWNYHELTFVSPMDGATIYLDGVQLEEGAEVSPFEMPYPYEVSCEFPRMEYKVYFPEESRTAQLKIHSAAKTPEKLSCIVELRDFKNRPVSTRSCEVETVPGKTVTRELRFEDKQYGWFQVHTTLLNASGKKLAENDTAFAVIPHPDDTVALKDSFFGMMVAPTHVERNGLNEGYQILAGTSLDDEFRFYHKIGLRWLRIQTLCSWWNAEPVKGADEWAKWDYLAGLANQHKFGVLAEFMGHRSPAWAIEGGKYVKGTYQIAKLDEVRDFAERWSRHFSGRIQAIQLMNETGGYRPADFLNVVKTIAPIFRRNMPGTELMFPSFPGVALPHAGNTAKNAPKKTIDDSWMGYLYSHGLMDYTDLLDTHIYLTGMATSKTRSLLEQPFDCKQHSEYGTFAETLEARLNEFRKRYPGKGVVNSESGTINIVTAPWLFVAPLDKIDWYTPEVSLGRSVRFSILQMAIGFQREYYFMLLGMQLERHGLDLICKDLTPTAAVPARAFFAKMLDGAGIRQKKRIGEGTWLCVFSKHGKNIAVYWDATLENRKAGTITPTGVRGICYDVMGNAVSPDKNGAYPLESTPCYFVSDLPAQQLFDAFAKAPVTGINALSLKPALTREGKLVYTIQNNSDKIVPEGTLKLKTAGVIELAAKELPVPAIGPRSAKTIAVEPKFTGTNALFSVQAEHSNGVRTKVWEMPAAFFHRGAKNPLPSVTLAYDVKTDRYSPSFVPMDKNRKTPVGGKLYAWYTDKALFLESEVTDDGITPADPQGDIHKGDTIEYFFDFQPEGTTEAEAYSANGFRIILSPTQPIRMLLDRELFTSPQMPNDFLDLQRIRNEFQKTDGGYRIRTEIPLKKPFFPGMLFRFCVQYKNMNPSGYNLINWTYGRAYRCVSRLGLGVCK